MPSIDRVGVNDFGEEVARNNWNLFKRIEFQK